MFCFRWKKSTILIRNLARCVHPLLTCLETHFVKFDVGFTKSGSLRSWPTSGSNRPSRAAWVKSVPNFNLSFRQGQLVAPVRCKSKMVDKEAGSILLTIFVEELDHLVHTILDSLSYPVSKTSHHPVKMSQTLSAWRLGEVHLIFHWRRSGAGQGSLDNQRWLVPDLFEAQTIKLLVHVGSYHIRIYQNYGTLQNLSFSILNLNEPLDVLANKQPFVWALERQMLGRNGANKLSEIHHWNDHPESIKFHQGSFWSW